MNKINHTKTLHEAISLLKMQQVGQLDQLKEQYQHTYAHYKPTNILKRYLNNLTSYAVFKGNIMSKIIGIGTGYLTKKVLLGSTPNIFSKLVVSLVQRAITSSITKKIEKTIDKSIHSIQELK